MGAALLLLACGPAEPTHSRPLFRHVITDAREIRLGDTLSSTGGVDRGAGDATASGGQGGTQMIGVIRGADGAVQEIVSNYPQTADFAALVAGYSAALGPPVAHRKPLMAESAEVVTWADTATRFELVRDPRRSVSTVYTRLSDRRNR
jgi:hypothetical protein